MSSEVYEVNSDPSNPEQAVRWFPDSLSDPNKEGTSRAVRVEHFETSEENPHKVRRKMGKNNGMAFLIAAIVIVVLVVLVILLALTFSGLDYYEYGFKTKRSTGVVNRGKVYGPGRYALGPDFKFKVFNADAHYEEFDDVTVFTSDKLQVTISASLQYFLRKHQLIQLLNKFDVSYEKTMRNNALSSIKNGAIKFTARDYIDKRSEVEAALFSSVRQRLGGTCCEVICEVKEIVPVPMRGVCVHGCVPVGQCNDTHFGLYTEVRYFQLGRLEVPDSLQTKYLRALVLSEEDSRERLVQEAQLIRKDTGVKVQEIDNEASEQRMRSEAEAKRRLAFAEADAAAKIEEARSSGQKYLYTTLNFTAPAHKASFDYLRTMKGLDHLQLAIGFDQLRVNSNP